MTIFKWNFNVSTVDTFHQVPASILSGVKHYLYCS